MNLAEIQQRWSWDEGIAATPTNIKLAIERTGNSYGITVAGKPYIDPVVGMRVHARLWHRPEGDGTIIELRKGFGGDPEAVIKLDDGSVVYLFQTALNGYTPIPSVKEY